MLLGAVTKSRRNRLLQHYRVHNGGIGERIVRELTSCKLRKLAVEYYHFLAFSGGD